MEGPDGDSQAGTIKVRGMAARGLAAVIYHASNHSCCQHAHRGFGWSPRKWTGDELENKRNRDEGALYVFQITTIDQ
jgi:hypothetical protein